MSAFCQHVHLKFFRMAYSSFLPLFQPCTGRKYPTTREYTSHLVPCTFFNSSRKTANLAKIFSLDIVPLPILILARLFETV